jgi:hypothetical protein
VFGHPSAIGKYAVQRLLGEGSMGRVYLATDPEGRRVAVKVLHPDLAAEPAYRDRFRREARISSSFRHPAAVACLEAQTSAEPPYLVLELVEGGDLGSFVASRGPLADATALALLEEIATAVNHAHSAGLVHRDLKPQNILLTLEGRPKVSDFGLARRTGVAATRFTREGQILGTADFVAPEQALGAIDVDATVDDYALGGLLHFLVTRRPPYVADTPVEIMALHVDAPPPDPRAVRPEVGPVVAELVAALMAKRPADRPGKALLERIRAARQASGSTGPAVLGAIPAPDVRGPAALPVPTPGKPDPAPQAIVLDFALEDARPVRVVAYAATRPIVLGRDASPPVELTLRVFPGESSEAALMRVSGKHGQLVHSPGLGFSVEDLGSRNGTTVNGASLRPGEPRAIADRALVDVGGAVQLRARVLGVPPEGLLLLRVKNAPGLAYLLVHGELPLSGILHLVTGAPWGAAELGTVRLEGDGLSIRAGAKGEAPGVSWSASAFSHASLKSDPQA